MGRKKIALVNALLIAFAVAAMAVDLLNGCAQKTEQLETVRIGASAQPVAGLIYIAEEKGLFKQRGINALIEIHDAGFLATKALIADTVDVATASEFVMAQRSFDNRNLRVFAQIANTNATELVARKDRGIEKLSDLKGKKVGLPRGSVADFFLGSYLRHNNMPLSSVEMVDIAPTAAEEALYKGSVDAVVIWEPHVTRIKKRLDKNAMSWPVQGRDDYYFILVTKQEFLRRSPLTAEKILRALIDAEAFADKHPQQAQQIIESRIKYPPGDVQLRWARSTLKVRLDQALLTLMEAEAQWMIRNGVTTKKEMPNYLNLIDLKPLEAVKPETVGIIH